VPIWRTLVQDRRDARNWLRKHLRPDTSKN
jgi:hypothetical protein